MNEVTPNEVTPNNARLREAVFTTFLTHLRQLTAQVEQIQREGNELDLGIEICLALLEPRVNKLLAQFDSAVEKAIDEAFDEGYPQ